jgi:quinol monooxygenase YgiN
MIIRIVKMTLHPDRIESFKENFTKNMHKISRFDGCNHLELLQDDTHSNILMTYSYWDSHEALDNYRHSPLFKSIWAIVKPMFIEKTQAWSLKQEFKL